MHPSARTHGIHRLRLDEVHTTFSDQRLVSIAKPQEGFLCRMCLNSVFTQTTYTQDRFRHVHPHGNRTVSSDHKNFSQICLFPYPWSGFPFAPLRQVCTIRLFQFGVPKPFGTHVGQRLRCRSSPDLHGFLGPSPWLFSFLQFDHSGITLAQIYDIDFVFNCVNVLLVRLGIWIFEPPPRSPSCRGVLVTNSLVRDDPFFRTRSILCHCQVFPLLLPLPLLLPM